MLKNEKDQLATLCCVPWRLEQTAESHSLLSRLSRAWPPCHCTSGSRLQSVYYYSSLWLFMIRFLSNDSWLFLDRFLWCHLKCIVWVLSLFLGSIDARTWRGYRLDEWAPLTISVWWRGRTRRDKMFIFISPSGSTSNIKRKNLTM